MICDRCHKEFAGEKFYYGDGLSATAGYYEVGPIGDMWGKFANAGEKIVCAPCMWSDPRYIAVYGNVGESICP